MKTQMKFQKWLCFALLILTAAAIVFALVYCTGVLYGFSTIGLEQVGKVDKSFEAGGNLYLEIADSGADGWCFCDTLLYLGIVMLLAVVLLYITCTNKRRNYYISNYVVTIAVAVVLVAISLYLFISNASYLSQVLEILDDSDAMEYYLETAEAYSTSVTYSTNISMFIFGYILYILIICGAGALIFNLVWKIKLMKGEKALLEKGFEKEVA